MYFAEGIPYFIVNNISVTMFTKMGVPNGEMALFTSLLYLPWTLKPLWSPLVDIFRTKRWWIVMMQALVSAAFVLLALTLPSPETSTQVPMSLFTFTLLLFVFAAFSSATHDIAADGFYMIALDSGQQSFFVGIRSTFYRLSSIFGQGVLVVVAGVLEEKTGNIPLAWALTIGLTAVIFTILTIYHSFALPRPAGDSAVSTDGSGSAGEFAKAFASFFRKPGVWIAIILDRKSVV